MDISQSQIVSFIWGIADDCLRDVFVRGQYRDVILPMVVLRRFDALLEPTKDKVEEEIKAQRAMGLDEESFDEGAICDITKLSFYNSSKWTLNRIKSNATDNNDLLCENFIEYLNGYSENVKDVLRNFDFYNKVRRLASRDRLLSIIEKITDQHINLTDKPAVDPDGLPLPPVSNIAMGTIFEELLRRFNEENNEEAGEHFTPRDAIELLARLVFEPIKDNLPKTISMYDPAEGSGGMLTEGRDYLISLGVSPSAIQLFGTEINPETYAICKADLIIKGVDPSGMHLGNTITDNYFAEKNFGFSLTNPPYGKSWKTDKAKIYHDNALLDSRFELRLKNFIGIEETVEGTPRTSDGQLLFMLEEINKMKPLEYQPQGSRIASIHNGSSLFTGEAGQGENNIRRYVIENDYVEAIIQLPNNIFYNTGISTYVWLLTNKKSDNRKGKVQLIDASKAFEKLKKNQGARNCTITRAYADMILDAYIKFEERKATDNNPVVSKIFSNDDFRYYSVTIERPLRLKSQFTALKIDELLFEAKNNELYKYIYQTYGERVFIGLNDEIPTLKEYFQDNDIKVTDKNLDSLISAKRWIERRDLMEVAQKIEKEVGGEEFTNYNIFYKKVCEAIKKLSLKLTATQIKTICKAMSVVDSAAAPVIAKEIKTSSKEYKELIDVYGVSEQNLSDYGLFKVDDTIVKYEADSELRDGEKIPVADNIYDYFLREVKPYVNDAWIELPSVEIGCEISFNKYFYKPAPLRTLEENEVDILALEQQSKGFINSLFEN